jgi:hypothetical protein
MTALVPNQELFLVYDAQWYRPLILPGQVIVHPASKTRACNAGQMLILSYCSLVWYRPLIYVLLV